MTIRAFAAVCISLAQLQNSNCRLYCRMSGYDSGVYSDKIKSCYCADKMPRDALLQKSLHINAGSKLKATVYDTPFPEPKISFDPIVLPWE